MVIASIISRFSSCSKSAVTLHLAPSLSLIPAELRIDIHALLFHVNPSMNGCEVNASASEIGLVSLPTNSRSKSISTNPKFFAFVAISRFFPVKDFFSPWSCLSPNAETTAILDRSWFSFAKDTAARYAIPPAQISTPPSKPNFHALITLSLSISSSGIS